MGFLRNLLLAAGSLAAAEAGLVTGWELPWLVIALVPLPYALGGAARALGTRGSFRAAGLVAWLQGLSAPLVQVIACSVLGWQAAALDWLGAGELLTSWPGPELFLALGPYVATELASIDARARAIDPRPSVRRGYRRLHLRMFASGLAPILLLLLLTGGVALSPTLLAWVEEVQLAGALFSVVLLAGFALFIPRILTGAWETARLPEGWQRLVLEETARRAGFRCRDIRVWRTSNLVANAAIVGFLPSHRVVLFSDALLAQLGPAELAAVFGHEIGHAVRRHVWILGSWALGCVLLMDGALRWASFDSELLELGILGALLVLGYFAFGYLSRRFELDADLASLEATGDPDGLIRALEQVGGAHAREQTGWRHFSIARRVRFIVSQAADPGVGERLRRTLRRWAVAGAAVFTLAVGAELVTLAQALPEDRMVVALRLGRYEQALDLARGLAELDPRLQGAVAAAAREEPGAGPEGLLASGLRRLRAGDLTLALGCVDLASLRGQAVPKGVREALLALVDGDSEQALGAAERVERPEWREALVPRR